VAQSGSLSVALVAALAVPVVVGCVVGWSSARRAPADDLGLASRLLDALVAACVAALLLAVVIALSAGPIGPGRLSHVGANAMLVAPFLAMGLAVGAMPVAALATWRRRRRLSCEISREETSREPVSHPAEMPATD
jgi:hypothetical protein